ncbi:LuxR C-terminal-related transcriptional regulator [Arthrobacter sp. NPDC080031]|uniref:helix-turn-helix transcriptional regulator n=1 Tax=Arthrobacter sp. NPDC080031 TaxID=3155918 RepID=UPI00344B9700
MTSRTVVHPGLSNDDTPAAVLKRTRQCGGGIVVLTGIQGIGKTTWCLQLTDALRRANVVACSADTFESTLALSFIDKLLVALGHRGAEPLSDVVMAARQLLSALAARPKNISCMVIDNAQWIDERSAKALRFVLQRLADDKITVVLAGVSGAGTAAIDRMVSDDLSWGFIKRVTLEPLSPEQVQDYVAQVWDRTISARTAERLRRSTGGTPLLINAAMEHTAGPESSAQNPWPDAVPYIASGKNPFAAMLDALELGPARSVVEFVCVSRDPIEQERVQRIGDALHEPTDVAAALASGLVRGTRTGQTVQLRPFHDLLAVGVRDSLKSHRLSSIHRAIAGEVDDPRLALQHRLLLQEPGTAELFAEVSSGVDHALADGQPELALQYLRSAMDRFSGSRRDDCIIEACLVASVHHCIAEVMDLLPQVQSMLPGPVRDFALLQLLQMRPDLDRTGQFAEELIAKELDHPDEALLRAHISLAIVVSRMVSDDKSSTAVAVAQAHRYLAHLGQTNGEVHDPRLRHLPSGTELGLQFDGFNLIGASGTQDPDLISKAFASLSARISGANDSPALADALTCRAGFLSVTGGIEQATVDLERAMEVSASAGAGLAIGHARVVLAYCYFLLGRVQEMLTVIRTAQLLSLDVSDVSSRPLVFSMSAVVEAVQGRSETYEAALRRAEEVRISDYDTFGVELSGLARLERARSLAEWQQQLEASEAIISGTPSMHSYRIDALAGLGRAEEADRLLQACKEMNGRGWWPVYGSLDWLEGRVSEAYGLSSRAARFYRLAAKESRFPLSQGIAQLDLGRLLISLGNTKAAGTALRAAVRIFLALGAAPYLSRATKLLDGLSGRPGNPYLQAFESLTGREREIAFYAERGMTNKQIAAQLFVSPATVNFHIRNVLAKLGLRSRRELGQLFTPGFEGSASSQARMPPRHPF